MTIILYSLICSSVAAYHWEFIVTLLSNHRVDGQEEG